MLKNVFSIMKLDQDWLNPLTEVRQSPINQKGLFAKENITKGTKIVIFGGKLIYNNDLYMIPKGMQDYNIQIDENVVLLSDGLHNSDFINHSCCPNSGFKGQIILIAMRDIKKNEEITFDYAMVVSGEKYNILCHCGSPYCRLIITENDWKLKNLQKRYKNYFAQYIEDKI